MTSWNMKTNVSEHPDGSSLSNEEAAANHARGLSQEERHGHGKAFVTSARDAMQELADYHTKIRASLKLKVIEEESKDGVSLRVLGDGTPDVQFRVTYDANGVRLVEGDEGDRRDNNDDTRGIMHFASPVGGNYQYVPKIAKRGDEEYVEWVSAADGHNLEGLLVRDLTRFTYGKLEMEPRRRAL